MSVIDTYGAFDLPEEKSEIEVIEDPVKFLNSAWELFEKSVKDVYGDSFKDNEYVYQKAVNVLEGKEKLKINGQQVLDFLNKQKKFRGERGLFLCAVHNVTDMKTLLVDKFVGVECFDNTSLNLGYKLKKDKNIILESGICAYVNSLGTYSEGNIINRGRVNSNYLSLSGTIINFGEIENIYTTDISKSMYINQKRIIYMQESELHQENFINNGEIWNLHKGIDLINLGKIGAQDKSGKILNVNKIDKLLPLKLKLEEKLKEIEFLKDTTDIKKIDKFDFNKFKDETIEINKEIVRKIYK